MQALRPYDNSDMPKYLPVGLTQYVLNNFPKKSPPCHVIQDAVSAPLEQLEVEKITGHKSVRGRGGVTAVLYKTHWVGLSEPSWEREMGLQLSRTHSLRYWASIPGQHRQTNRLSAGFALARYSVSFLETTARVLWYRATRESNARSGLAATTTQCSDN